MPELATNSELKQARFLAITGIGMASTQIVGLMLSPILVALSDEFNVSVAAAGQLAAVTFAAWAVSVVSVGPISDSFGRRPVAVIGLTLLAASVIASSFAPTFGVLMGLRIITGLAGGMIPPNSMAAVADVLPADKRAKAFGLLMAFTSLSSVIGVPLVALVAGIGGWRVPFLMIGSVLFICAGMQSLWFPKSQTSETRKFSFMSRYKQMANISLFRTTLVANLLQRMAFYASISYLAAYLINSHGLSIGQTAIPLAIAGIGVVIGSMAAGFISALRRRSQAVSACALLGGLASLLMFSIDLSAWGTVAVALIGITFISVGWPTFLAISTEISGSSQATAVGMLGASNQLGGVGGAALGGAFLALGDFYTVGFFCLATVLISAVVLQLGMGIRPTNQES